MSPDPVTISQDRTVDVYETLRLISMCSEKVLSFSSAGEGGDTFYCWLIDYDFEELDKRLKKEKLNVGTAGPPSLLRSLSRRSHREI
ncbi:MAG: hypothetical protein C4291_07350 [Candidatus Dadabacteria bacterium]